MPAMMAGLREDRSLKTSKTRGDNLGRYGLLNSLVPSYLFKCRELDSTKCLILLSFSELVCPLFASIFLIAFISILFAALHSPHVISWTSGTSSQWGFPHPASLRFFPFPQYRERLISNLYGCVDKAFACSLSALLLSALVISSKCQLIICRTY